MTSINQYTDTANRYYCTATATATATAIVPASLFPLSSLCRQSGRVSIAIQFSWIRSTCNNLLSSQHLLLQFHPFIHHLDKLRIKPWILIRPMTPMISSNERRRTQKRKWKSRNGNAKRVVLIHYHRQTITRMRQQNQKQVWKLETLVRSNRNHRPIRRRLRHPFQNHSLPRSPRSVKLPAQLHAYPRSHRRITSDGISVSYTAATNLRIPHVSSMDRWRYPKWFFAQIGMFNLRRTTDLSEWRIEMNMPMSMRCL